MSIDLTSFKRAAEMALKEHPANRISVTMGDEDVVRLIETVYVWVDRDNMPLRVGTSVRGIGTRLRQYANHINNAFEGRPSPTPLWEARLWVEKVRPGPIAALAYQPPEIDTVAGRLRPFLDIERQLIKQFRDAGYLLLNRSHR